MSSLLRSQLNSQLLSSRLCRQLYSLLVSQLPMHRLISKNRSVNFTLRFLLISLCIGGWLTRRLNS